MTAKDSWRKVGMALAEITPWRGKITGVWMLRYQEDETAAARLIRRARALRARDRKGRKL